MGPIDRVLSDPYQPYTKELINVIPQIPGFAELNVLEVTIDIKPNSNPMPLT
ncbi:MAG TPA: hypothetical protein VGJ42_01295 [Nitrososphaera sp.]